MRSQPTAASSRPSTQLTPRNGIIVLSGYGVRVSVDRGHLVLSDNLMGERREGRLSRATAKLKRLVVLGHTGMVTLEALHWLTELGAAFVQLDGDGQVVNCYAPPGLDDARLRRA